MTFPIAGLPSRARSLRHVRRFSLDDGDNADENSPPTMPLHPLWRTRLFAAGAAIVGVWLSFDIAAGNLTLAAILSSAVVLFVLAQWQPLALTVVLLGVMIFGYVVGSRGFAQLMLLPQFPLLPAEAVLLVTGPLVLLQAAWRHELPLRRDPLNFLLMGWIVYGALRLVFDFRLYGVMAARDFAMVYYACFFFLAQEVTRQPAPSRWLQTVLFASTLVLAAVYAIYDQLPDFFLGTFTFRGVPLIFFKGDLVGTYLAVGSVLAWLRFEETRARLYLAVSLLMAGAVMMLNNRAALLGLVVATLWLAAAGRWRFALLQIAGATASVVLVLLVATVTDVPWEKTPLLDVYERAVSLTDPTGKRTYVGDVTYSKGGNNLFRTVWWQAVFDETIEGNPYTGLGFGYDLAARFTRQYYPENGEEFSARSPHNLLLTIFARMGGLGLALFLGIIACIARGTWRALRTGPIAAAPWCAAWVILTSACFGVVLEGPMGAVVFWIILGVAHATPATDASWVERSKVPDATAAALPSTAPAL